MKEETSAEPKVNVVWRGKSRLDAVRGGAGRAKMERGDGKGGGGVGLHKERSLSRNQGGGGFMCTEKNYDDQLKKIRGGVNTYTGGGFLQVVHATVQKGRRSIRKVGVFTAVDGGPLLE